ncbi:MAG: type II secretion system protein GspG [Planctomycetota bacterium]|jgi:general secretion pathway protein G
MKTRSNHNKNKNKRRAFTLVEMIVVVTIIALLATLVAPRLLGQISGAKKKVAKTGANSIAAAVKLYIVDSGVALNDDFDLEMLALPPDEGGGPEGPYVENAEKLVDPWGNPFMILVPGEVNYDFDIISFGPDGQLGTEDDITH